MKVIEHPARDFPERKYFNQETNEFTASWKNFGYECAICGVGNLSDLEIMIDSLYTEIES